MDRFHTYGQSGKATHVCWNSRLSLGGIRFNTLCELVAYYSTPGANLLKNEWLLYPVPAHSCDTQTDDQPDDDQLAQLHQRYSGKKRLQQVFLYRRLQLQTSSKITREALSTNFKNSKHELRSAISMTTIYCGQIV